MYVSSEIVVVIVTIVIFDSSRSTESREFREIVNVEADYHDWVFISLSSVPLRKNAQVVP